MKITYRHEWEVALQSHGTAFAILRKLAGDIYEGRNASWDLSAAGEAGQLQPLIEEGLISVSGDQISFADETFAAFVLALYFVEAHVLPTANRGDAIPDYIEIPRPLAPGFKTKTLAAYGVIVLNNVHGWNIPQFVENQTKNGTVFPREYLSFCEALPYLIFQSDSLVPVFSAIQEATKNDGTSGFLFSAIADLCTQQPIVGNRLLTQLLEIADAKVAAFIPNIMDGLSKNNFATIHARCVSLADDSSLPLSCYGLISLGILDYESHPQLLDETIDKLDDFFTSARAGREHALAVAYGRVLLRDRTLVDRIRDLIRTGDVEAIHAIAESLWRDASKLSQESWFKSLVRELVVVKPAHKGTLTRVDYILHDIVARDIEFVAGFLDEWLERHADELRDEDSVLLKVFDMTASVLMQNVKLVQHLITAWLCSECGAHHDAAAEIVAQTAHFRDAEPRELELDVALLDSYPIEDVVVVIHKVLGFVHEPLPLCSLIFSVLRRTPMTKRLEATVVDVFVEYIAYNYPGSAREFLNARIFQGSDQERAITKQVLERVDRYFGALRGLPRLKEFEPSRKLAHGFARARSKRTAQDMEKAQTQSVFLNLLTKIPLKRGRSWFSWIENGYSPPSQLSTISHSIEYPRGLSIDPLGIDVQLTRWRNDKRGD